MNNLITRKHDIFKIPFVCTNICYHLALRKMQTIGNDLNAKEIDIFNDSLQSIKDRLHARFLKIIAHE